MESEIFNSVEYCVILDKDTGDLILAQKVRCKVETIHIVKRYTRIADIPLEEVHPYNPEEGIDDFKLYNYKGKVILGKNIK